MSDPHDVIDALAQRSLDAAELAIYVSPAVRAEPELLRALRLRLLPAAGAQAEADLWFSPLVRARGLDGIALHDDVLRVLRGRLHERWRDQRQKPRTELAWTTIEEMHANASPALVLEERVAWLVISGASRDRLDRELYQALRAIERGNRPNLARWAANAWRRLPPEAQKTSAGWLLGQVSGGAKRGPVRVMIAPEDVARVDVAALVGYRSRAALGVRREGGVLELGAVSGPGAAAIEVLDTEPRLVEVLPGGSGGGPTTPLPVPSGTVVRLNVGEGMVRLVTALQEVYELPPTRAQAPPDIFALLAAAPIPISTALIDFRTLVDDVTRFFTGRQNTLAELDAALGDASFRSGYISITGEPGIGKTALLGHLVRSRGYVHHFNNSVQGVTSPRAFLGNVCAQLIVRYRLDHGALPAEVTDDETFLSRLLAEAVAKAAGEAVVVLVDAVDEAEPPPARRGANPLLLPYRLPDGAFLIVTMRAGARGSLDVEHRHELRLEPDYADIREYVVRRLASDPNVVAGFGMDVGSLAALLADRSQGNFMYAALVTQDLLAGRSEPGTLEDLLPRSLSAYYARHWHTMRGSDPERIRLVYEPVLRVLANADEPVSVSDLQEQTALSRSALEKAIREWSPFLAVVRSEGNERKYGLYHPSFRQFVADVLGLVLPGVQTAEQKLAAAAEASSASARARVLLEAMAILPEEPRAAAAEEALASALAIPDHAERAALLASMAPFLSSRQLDAALAAVRAFTDPSLRAKTLVRLAPYLGRDAQDEVVFEALQIAESITDDFARGQLLVEIANVLSGSGSDELLELAIGMARAVEDTRERGGLLLAIARVLPEAKRIGLLLDAINVGSAETVAAASQALEEIAPGQSHAADPVQALWLPNGRPFVDRASLRMAIRELMNPDGLNTLVVNGPPKSGKSYTFSFIRYIAERTRAFQTVYVRLKDFRVCEPIDVIREIAVVMGLSSIPDPPFAETLDRTLRVLANWLRAKIAASDSIWWWILDDCSSPHVPASTRELIRVLAQMADDSSGRLRLILLGFEESLGYKIDRNVYREQLTHIGEGEIRQWFAGAYQLAGADVPPGQVDEAIRALFSGVAKDATIAELSPALQRISAALLPSSAG